MNTDEKVYPSGQHYSGQNRIPTIKQFVESLDKQKRERDAQIDSQRQTRPNRGGKGGDNDGNGEVKDHVPTGHRKPGKNRRTVRDPMTGKDVEIEDISSGHMKAAEEPMVSPYLTLLTLSSSPLSTLSSSLPSHPLYPPSLLPPLPPTIHTPH